MGDGNAAHLREDSFFLVFSSGGVLELFNVSNLSACSHYRNFTVFKFDEMHLSIPSFGTEF